MTNAIRRAGYTTLVMVTLMVVGSGCGELPDGGGATDVETRRGAVSTATSHLVVPAYFGDSSPDWATITTGAAKLPPGSIVIAPGPAYSFDSDLYARLAALHANGVIVLGYLPIGYKDSTIDNDLLGKIGNWENWYGGGDPGTYGPGVVDGIFFDEAQRSFSEDVGKFAWLAHFVTSSSWASSPGYVMFNISVPYLEHQYVDCTLQSTASAGTTLFLSQENSEDYYLSPTNASNWSSTAWNWINNYKPTHFAHVLHDASTSTSTTNAAIGDARTWNAAYVYVTDGQIGNNEYGQLSAVYSDLLAGTNAAHSDFGGASADSLTESCPALCSYGDGSCWCTHTECGGREPLQASCSPCASAVCAQDPYCCTYGWDNICVSEVETYCDAAHSCM
jgi:Spherulation-specific family 4